MRKSVPSKPARLVFREITDGDRLKFVAKSNLTKSGGGARDLRFRGWSKLAPTLTKLFPNQKVLTRKRSGQKQNLTVYSGDFFWLDESQKECSQEVLLEPPTDARPQEGRITKVHEYACFVAIPKKSEGRLLLLFIQNDDGKVWPYFASEKSLQEKNWNKAVAIFLLDALNAAKPGNTATYGFVDFENNEQYTNG
jgi:hypothetical protein